MTVGKALRLAAACWKRGQPAPIDALVALLDAGYDIGQLEARYGV